MLMSGVNVFLPVIFAYILLKNGIVSVNDIFVSVTEKYEYT